MSRKPSRQFHHTELPGDPNNPEGGGYVYFLYGAGLTKIGHSSTWRARTIELRNMSPVPVDLLLVITGGQGIESLLHREFAECRRHGEWFALPDHWRDVVGAVVQRLRLRVVIDAAGLHGEKDTLGEKNNPAIPYGKRGYVAIT